MTELALADLPTGVRCWERARNGDALPRGGIVIGHLHDPDRVVCATRWSAPPKRNRVTKMPFLDVDIIRVDEISPDTIEPVTGTERIRLARAVASMIGARASGTRTDDDDRDLALLRELMAPPVPTRYRSPIGDAPADDLEPVR